MGSARYWPKASLASRMAGVPWHVHTEHGRAYPDPWIARTLDGAAAKRTDIVVAVSGTVADLLKTRVTPLWNRIHVIPNGVDVDVFRPAGANVTRPAGATQKCW